MSNRERERVPSMWRARRVSLTLSRSCSSHAQPYSHFLTSMQEQISTHRWWLLARVVTLEWSHWSGEGAAWTWWRQKWKWIEWSKDQPWQVPVILGTWKCWSYFLVIPIVNELMKYKKVNPNICDSHNRTALWLAAKKKRIDFNLSVNIVHSALGDWHCHQAKRRTTPSTICELSLGVCQRQWQVPGEISWHAVFMSIHIQASDLLSTSLLSFSHFSQKWFFLLYYCYYFHL